MNRKAMLRRLFVPAWFVLAVVVAAVAARFFPHPWNLTPVGGMFLFSGFAARRWIALTGPLGAYALSDFILDTFVYHSPFGFSTLFVWLGFALVWLIGRALKRFASLWWLLPAATASAVAFYVVSNFGAWLASGIYPLTVEGLLAAYTAGLPFFQPTLVGDVVFGTVFFGLSILLSARPAERAAQVR